MHSKNVFDTVSIAKELPRGRIARGTRKEDENKQEDVLQAEKEEGMGPVAKHDSNPVGFTQ